MRKSHRFVKNIIYAVGAQVVSLSASLVVSFIAPKFINVTDFAYWQLFLFYVSYVNISRLGLIDGIYLRLAGKDYEKLDHNLLSVEWIVFTAFQLIVSIILFLCVSLSEMDIERKFVYGACCICIVIINSNNYFSYLLQTTNQTKKYSVSLIIQNVFWFIAVGIIVIFKIYTYKIIVIMYVMGHVFAGFYLMRYTKEIWHIKKCSVYKVLLDIRYNIKCGIMLMISLYAGNLVIGSTKIIIDRAWGVETFGYFSFALTLANFVLTFINQVSLVMFPALKRIPDNKRVDTYLSVRNLLRIALPLVLMGYYPICILVEWWLPKYVNSLVYLTFFLPICTFDGKMQMLCSTFFKVLRKEKMLMFINVSTMILSTIIAFIGSYIVKDVIFVAVGLLFVIAARSIVSEVILAKIMKADVKGQLLQEIMLILLYVILALILEGYIIFVSYAVCYLIYLVLNKDNIIPLIKRVSVQNND